MSVATRPGASGVPLWSSLHILSDVYIFDEVAMRRYLACINALVSGFHRFAQVVIPARSVERSLRYNRVNAGLHQNVSQTVQVWFVDHVHAVPKCGGGFQIKLL
jgi:hypothetical protein